MPLQAGEVGRQSGTKLTIMGKPYCPAVHSVLVSKYSPVFAGGNFRHRYADVEAMRVDIPDAQLGAKARLSEAWDRYAKPLAVTEAHQGSTRDEQVRWLMEVWRAAEQLRGEGIDVSAVTVWSLFGAVDWNSLLVNRSGFYEPGAFDIRSGEPRLTAIGTLAGSLARLEALDHAVLRQPGWWRRDIRYYDKRNTHTQIASAKCSGHALAVGSHQCSGLRPRGRC